VLSAAAGNFVFGGYLMPFADALGIGALALLLLGVWPVPAMVSVFLLTFFVYALNRVIEIDIDGMSNPERTFLLQSQRRIQITLLTLSICGAVVLQVFAASWAAVLCAALWLAAGVWYCFGLKTLTRRVLGLKAYVIGLMYGLWPLYALWFLATSLPPGALEVTAFIVIRMFFSTTVSDIKDIAMDRAQGLRTFAVVMTPARLRIMLHALNAASALPILAGLLRGSLPLAAAGLLLCIPYGLFFPRANSGDSRSARLLTAIIVDSEGLIWVLGVLLGLSVTGSL
jgi:4-hydroxybenzoate polyprenyltransferase